jgi:hypothetical protein
MRKPRSYVIAGAGIITSMLLKVNGNETLVSVKTYQQSKLAVLLGVGAMSRLASVLVLDAAIKYITADKYNPG